MKGLRKRQLHIPTITNENLLPVKDSWIIIEFLVHLKLSKRPGINLFNRFLESYNNIWDLFFEEIDELLGPGL